MTAIELTSESSTGSCSYRVHRGDRVRTKSIRRAMGQQYPEFADPLQLIANYGRLNGIVARMPAGPAELNERTILSGDVDSEIVQPDASRVRYFGDYELLEEIARGGMGVVFRTVGG